MTLSCPSLQLVGNDTDLIGLDLEYAVFCF